MKTNYHVINSFNKLGEWAVVREHASRASLVLSNKKEAIKRALILSKNENSDIYIHDSDGGIEKVIKSTRIKTSNAA